jgi:lipopolysaccharide assembly protein A
MRYIKVLVLVLVFFLSMVFFFQNQKPLSQEVVLSLNLFVTPQMTSIGLPLYLITLVAFAVGAILSLLVLVWDKVNLSARLLKATWRANALEKEVEKLRAAQDPAAAKPGMLGRFRKAAPESPKPAVAAAAPKAEPKAEKPNVEDIVAPDPDKN